MNEKLEGKGCRLVDCDCDNDRKYSTSYRTCITQPAPQGTHLNRPVLAAANRHGVDGMDRHARHLPLVALEGVDGGGTGNHTPTGRGPTHATTSPGCPSQPGPMGVNLGALRRGPLQLQHLLLQAGDGRPLLLEEGRRRRLAAGLGLTRAGIGLRQGRRRGGKVLPRAGEQILVDARVEVGPLPIGQDHIGVGVVLATVSGPHTERLKDAHWNKRKHNLFRLCALHGAVTALPVELGRDSAAKSEVRRI